MYDLLGGNSSRSAGADHSVIEATFPRDPTKAEFRINGELVPIRYDPEIVDILLIRTRLHRYIDNSFLRAFFSK